MKLVRAFLNTVVNLWICKSKKFELLSYCWTLLHGFG
jgi:hypothetical protein